MWGGMRAEGRKTLRLGCRQIEPLHFGIRESVWLKFGVAVSETLLPSPDNVPLKDRDIALCISPTHIPCQPNPIMIPMAIFLAPGMSPISFPSDCSKDGHMTGPAKRMNFSELLKRFSYLIRDRLTRNSFFSCCATFCYLDVVMRDSCHLTIR